METAGRPVPAEKDPQDQAPSPGTELLQNSPTLVPSEVSFPFSYLSRIERRREGRKKGREGGKDWRDGGRKKEIKSP